MGRIKADSQNISLIKFGSTYPYIRLADRCWSKSKIELAGVCSASGTEVLTLRAGSEVNNLGGNWTAACVVTKVLHHISTFNIRTAPQVNMNNSTQIAHPDRDQKRMRGKKMK